MVAVSKILLILFSTIGSTSIKTLIGLMMISQLVADSSRILSVNFESLFVNHWRRFEVREAALLMMVNSKAKKRHLDLVGVPFFVVRG